MEISMKNEIDNGNIECPICKKELTTEQQAYLHGKGEHES